MAVIEGRNPIIEAIGSQRKIREIFLQKGIKGKRIDTIIKYCQKENITLRWVSKEKLASITKAHAHQGVIAIADEIKLYSPQEILDYAHNCGEKPFVLILDQIQDPHNFGSMIRTAYGAGVHGIIYQKDRAVDITPVVIKSSAGAIEHIRLAKVTNINNTIKKLKEQGLWIMGADIEGENLYYQTDLTGALGLVIGNEGEGLRRLVKENCDLLLKIPLKGKVASLNAAVAAAIIIYDVLRQKSTK